MIAEGHRDLYVTHLKMPRFVIGDELGNLKVLRVSSENNVALTAVYQKKTSSVEALAVGSEPTGTKTVRRATLSPRGPPANFLKQRILQDFQMAQHLYTL